VATSGAQPGNQNAKKAKLWEQALKRALARASNATIDAGLDKIADTVVSQAMEGNKDAWQEIGQRLDGKVPQALIGGDDDDPPLKFEKIERSIVRPDPKNTDG
jgi:hypothetical protein